MSLANTNKKQISKKKHNNPEVVLASLRIKTSFSEIKGLAILFYFRSSDFQMCHCLFYLIFYIAYII